MRPQEQVSKRERMLQDFSVYNEKGVNAAVKLMESGFFEGCALNEITAAEVFDALMEIEERVG